jgi:hypothetical protein
MNARKPIVAKTDESDLKALDRLAAGVTPEKLRPLTPAQRGRWEAARRGRPKKPPRVRRLFLPSCQIYSGRSAASDNLGHGAAIARSLTLNDCPADIGYRGLCAFDRGDG